jgi:hypothetical protein
MTKDEAKYPRMVKEWWKHWNNRQELKAAIADMKRVLVRARVSDTHAFAVVAAKQVFADQIVVIAKEGLEWFALFQSEIHNWWYRPLTSSMRTDVRYSPTDAVETFVLPKSLTGLQGIGQDYHGCRTEIMQVRSEGLTKIYNRFHNQEEKATDVRRLRDLQTRLDQAVLAAYGWESVQLRHDFFSTPRGARFTICEEARTTLFGLLMSLNHQHYEEQGTSGRNSKKRVASGKRKKGVGSTDEPTLF